MLHLMMSSSSESCHLLGNKGTVSSSSGTVDIVRAAVPVGIGAASSWAGSLIRSTLLLGSHLHELLLLGNKGTVNGVPSTRVLCTSSNASTSEVFQPSTGKRTRCPASLATTTTWSNPSRSNANGHECWFQNSRTIWT